MNSFRQPKFAAVSVETKFPFSHYLPGAYAPGEFLVGPDYLRLSFSWEFHGGCGCTIYRGRAPCGFKHEVTLCPLVMAKVLNTPHLQRYEYYFTLGINQYRGVSLSRALIVVSKSIRFQRGSWNIPTASCYFRKNLCLTLQSLFSINRETETGFFNCSTQVR